MRPDEKMSDEMKVTLEIVQRAGISYADAESIMEELFNTCDEAMDIDDVCFFRAYLMPAVAICVKKQNEECFTYQFISVA